MRKVASRLSAARISSIPGIAEGLALLAGVAYFFSAQYLAHTTLSFLDEGLYLFKGFLFANGSYTPFEDYGLWTNHMPLAFLIPGSIQNLFGPGLQAGRYFAIALGLLVLLGLWLLTRRLAGKWWAAGVVWAMALNPAEIKLYTMALSQSLVAFFLVWALVLTVGKSRPFWQIALGGFLTGLITMTRNELFLVQLLIPAYVLWQHGRKAGLLAFATGALPVIVGHIIYWPGILQVWPIRIPKGVIPILDAYRYPSGVQSPESLYTTKLGYFQERILYFWLVFRLHFVAFTSAVTALVLWVKRKVWASEDNFRTALLITGLLATLLFVYFTVAFGWGFCVSCIIMYVAFFDFLGLVLFAVSYSSLRKQSSPFRQILAGAAVLLLTIGVGYSTYEDLGHELMVLKVLRLKRMHFEPDRLWRLLVRDFGFEYESLRTLLPQIAGLLIGIVVLVFSIVIIKALARKYKRLGLRSFGLVSFGVLLIIGMILSPTVVLGKGNNFFACGSDVLASYQEVGTYLSDIIKPGERVYWEGRSVAIFLYLPDVEIFPPQLNHNHNFHEGGEPDQMLRLGRWNLEMAKQWLQEADVVLVEEPWLRDWEAKELYSGDFVSLGLTQPLGPCSEATRLLVFRRMP